MDVPRGRFKVASVADIAVPVIFLPELALAAKSAVDFTGGETFEAFDDIGEGEAPACGHEKMDVVRHDNVFIYVVAHGVKLQPGVDDYFSHLGILEATGAVATIKIIFNALAVSDVTIGGVEFASESLEELLRQRIGKAIGDGLDFGLVIKVRQLATVVPSFG